MELLEALTQTFDHTTKIVSGVRADQLDAPTPCEERELRALLAHTIGVVMNMAAAHVAPSFSPVSTTSRSPTILRHSSGPSPTARSRRGSRTGSTVR